jgi:phosphoribosylanthranilate isomerase
MVKVKICGITNLKDARDAVKAGCDSLGFVFYQDSPRYILPFEASSIIKKLPKYIIKVGVFVNAREKTIKKIARICDLDILQFHGRESPGFCDRFKKYRVIKSFRIRGRINLREISKYDTFAYLFDTFLKSKIGGTGKNFNWGFLTGKLTAIKKPIFLAGGLNEKNVQNAVRAVRPDWVDASSCLEEAAGKKDPKRVKAFIKAAKYGRP